jgi:iron complex outermembrane recepter protein
MMGRSNHADLGQDYGARSMHIAVWLTATLVCAAAAPVIAEDELEEVTVTGSRIERSGMTTATPVTIVDAQELDKIAPGTMIDGMVQLPQFLGSQTPNGVGEGDTWFTRAGYGMLNLRGLGVNRTLTLLNGRRMTSSTAFGGVDVNLFPEAAITRVETVTGGASAAYGADAVAGVVNFIINTDYNGLDLKGQMGQTAQSDNDTYEVSVTFGTDIGERAHILVSAEKFSMDGVQSYAGRDWYRGWGTVPDANGMLQVVPDVVSRNASFDGLIFAPGSAINGLQFHPDGSTTPFVLSDTTWSPAPPVVGIPPARQSITNGGSGDDLASQTANLMPEQDRQNIFLYGDFDVTDNIKVFGQYINGSNDTWAYNTPGGSFHGTPTALTIFQDNAFLPDSIRQTMINEGLQSFVFKRMGSFSDTQGQSWIWDENDVKTYTVGVDIDLKGGFFDGWSVGASYQKGESERHWYQHGLRVDRIFAAIDAVDDGNGNIVCRTSLFGNAYPGCQPLNLFGQGNASDAAIDYVMGFEPGQQITTPVFFADTGFDLGRSRTYTTGIAKVNHTYFDQDLFEVSASGKIAEGFGAGPIDLAVGYAYRDEKVLQLVDDVTNPASDHSGNFHPVSCDDAAIGLRGVSVPDCLNTVGVQYSKVSNIKGNGDVNEFFAETNIPLVGGASAMKLMSTNLAVRWADYSGSGAVWAYKAGLDLQFTESFRARATYSRDVRAPNMSERFDKTGGTTSVSDPQFGGEIYNVTRFSGGNPLVAPEEADTLTAGVVYQPSWLDGLSLSLDWYDIDIDGAIGQLGTQAVVNECEAGSSVACSLITRDPNTNRLVLVGDVFINIDRAIASGQDLEIDYSTDVDWFSGSEEFLAVRFLASHLSERSEQNAGAAKIDRAGQTGWEQSTDNNYALPDWKMIGNVTYGAGPLSVFLQMRYISDGKSENALVEGVNIDDNSVDSALYLDLDLSYDLKIANTNVQIFGNITNLTDEDPPVTPNYWVFGGYPRQTNPLLFDQIGRRYTVGFRMSFDQ